MRKRATPKKPKPLFTVTFHNGAVSHSLRGDSVHELLAQIPKVFPKGYSSLKLQKGSLVSEVRLRPIQMRRLALSNSVRDIFAKKLEMTLK